MVKDYVNVVIPNGFVPVQYYYQEKIGVYVEPNVWVLHELKSLKAERTSRGVRVSKVLLGVFDY